MRLQKYLSMCGVAARRKAEALIVAGRVRVNGKVVAELGTKVDPGADRITVDESDVQPEAPCYVLLNKPKGCVTAVSDPEGRPTVMAYLRGLPARVVPVGRLDFHGEGVLILTNDGELSARLQSPHYHVDRTYHVKVQGKVGPAALRALRAGVRLDDGTVTRPALVDRLASPSKHDWLVITLTASKSHQIHRMLEALGKRVTKLQRVAFAGITYHGLRVGDARELLPAEVHALREAVGLPRARIGPGTWSVRREDTDRARRTPRSAGPVAKPADRRRSEGRGSRSR
jgi:23S rRNA pseudouridine2605 synthase